MSVLSNARANSLLEAGNSLGVRFSEGLWCTDDPYRMPSITVQAGRSNQYRIPMTTLHLAEGAANASERMARQSGPARARRAASSAGRGRRLSSRTPIFHHAPRPCPSPCEPRASLARMAMSSTQRAN
jgi:hypothetical protein